MLFGRVRRPGTLDEAEQTPGLLRRLREDVRGNVLALTAASVIPMIGMVGSGIDLGRTYLVKTRLQQACDAGALAARKSLSGTALDQPAKDQGQNFFNINLKSGMYGSEDVTFELTDVTRFDPVSGTNVATGTVHGEATASVPMTLMKIFGKPDIDLTATCEAELNIANNDILFVLDLTGSMACLPTDDTASCDTYVYNNTPTVVPANGIWRTTEKTGSRISVLRQAVKDFYTTVNTARAPGTRLRIGFVPYSSGVDVSGLNINPTVASPSYMTRVATFNQVRHTPTTTWTAWGNDQTFGSAITDANCTNYGNNAAFSQSNGTITFNPSPAGNPSAPTAVISTGTKPADVTTTQYSRKSWTGTGTTNKTCVRQRRTGTTTYATRWEWTGWTYQPVAVPYATYRSAGTNYVSALSATATVTAQGSYNLVDLASQASTSGLTVTPTSWDGCVEEDATASIASANWWPAWRDITYGRTGSANQNSTVYNSENNSPFWQAAQDKDSLVQTAYACPRAAQRLAVMTQAQVDGYVDAPDFVPQGYTYHDIGMLWGARLMNTTGMFSADHGAAPNGRPIARHIVFMTDGDMKPKAISYGPYGVESVQGRVNGGTPLTNDTTLKTLHNTRFLAACAAARNNGVSVWVVAFGQALTTELRTCASSTTQTFQANNSAQLNAAFAQIAQRIADLRLVG